jgi:hypothetical protein
VRKGQVTERLTRLEFGERFRERFYDPAFEPEVDAIARLELIAWEAYVEGRKAPRTRAARNGFAKPDMQLSVEWLRTRERLHLAQERWQLSNTRSRVLLVCGAARNDGSCPGEMSKT